MTHNKVNKGESIHITHVSEELDNSGRTESSSRPELIMQRLLEPEKWSDDLHFFTEIGEKFSAEDLVGKLVKVGKREFILEDEPKTIVLVLDYETKTPIYVFLEPGNDIEEQLSEISGLNMDDCYWMEVDTLSFEALFISAGN